MALVAELTTSPSAAVSVRTHNNNNINSNRFHSSHYLHLPSSSSWVLRKHRSSLLPSISCSVKCVLYFTFLSFLNGGNARFLIFLSLLLFLPFSQAQNSAPAPLQVEKPKEKPECYGVFCLTYDLKAVSLHARCLFISPLEIITFFYEVLTEHSF